MNKLLVVLASALLACSARASEPSAPQIVRLMQLDRLAAYLVHTSLRDRALKLGAPEQDLVCLQTILPSDFTSVMVKSLDASLTPDVQSEVLAFLESPAGRRYASVTDAKISGKPKPVFTIEESAAIASFGDSDAGKKFLSTSNLADDGISERMAEVAKRAMNHCRQVMESREPAR